MKQETADNCWVVERPWYLPESCIWGSTDKTVATGCVSDRAGKGNHGPLEELSRGQFLGHVKQQTAIGFFNAPH